MAQTAPRTPPPARDWTAQSADRIESIVETVRDNTAVPVTKAASAVVYGLIVAVMGGMALMLLVIGLLRLHVYLPFEPEARKVYIADLGLGGLFLVLGALLWRRRLPSTKD